MCTASWLDAGGEFHLFFNRDELRTRPRAMPPREARAEGVRYLAPIDAAAMGTWIAASAPGLLLALLNRSEEGEAPRSGTVSRGSVIPALIAAPSLAEVETRLRRLPLEKAAPFRLFGRDPRGGRPLCWGWNGRELDRVDLDPEAGLLCSSGLGDARVTAARTPVWERLRAAGGLSPETLAGFHRSHEPRRSADSVCMHRDDARTVSHTAVRIVAPGDEVAFLYVEGSPCEEGALSAARLLRES
jgi:hypothetical protein